jgi:hypothetical protein
VTDDNPNETCSLQPPELDAALLITASELRDRKTKRRRKHDQAAEAIRRLVELRLKVKK